MSRMTRENHPFDRPLAYDINALFEHNYLGNSNFRIGAVYEAEMSVLLVQFANQGDAVMLKCNYEMVEGFAAPIFRHWTLLGGQHLGGCEKHSETANDL